MFWVVWYDALFVSDYVVDGRKYEYIDWVQYGWELTPFPWETYFLVRIKDPTISTYFRWRIMIAFVEQNQSTTDRTEIDFFLSFWGSWEYALRGMIGDDWMLDIGGLLIWYFLIYYLGFAKDFQVLRILHICTAQVATVRIRCIVPVSFSRWPFDREGWVLIAGDMLKI